VLWVPKRVPRRVFDWPVGSWHVDDIIESLELLLEAGAEEQQAIRDVGGGKLIVSVEDADGNVIGLIQSP
jgi:predicted enzyme related to lactoylglutathione lyase